MRFLVILPAIVFGFCAGMLLAQDDNAIRAVTVLHEDGTRTVTVTDPDKHTAEATTYDAGNKLMQKIVYALDDNNLPASGVVYAADNRPVYKAVYKHDDTNRISEEDDFTMDDRLIGRFVYEYGANGVRIHAYDSQGNEVEQSDARKDPQQMPPRVH